MDGRWPQPGARVAAPRRRRQSRRGRRFAFLLALMVHGAAVLLVVLEAPDQLGEVADAGEAITVEIVLQRAPAATNAPSAEEGPRRVGEAAEEFPAPEPIRASEPRRRLLPNRAAPVRVVARARVERRALPAARPTRRTSSSRGRPSAVAVVEAPAPLRVVSPAAKSKPAGGGPAAARAAESTPAGTLQAPGVADEDRRELMPAPDAAASAHPFSRRAERGVLRPDEGPINRARPSPPPAAVASAPALASAPPLAPAVATGSGRPPPDRSAQGQPGVSVPARTERAPPPQRIGPSRREAVRSVARAAPEDAVRISVRTEAPPGLAVTAVRSPPPSQAQTTGTTPARAIARSEPMRTRARSFDPSRAIDVALDVVPCAHIGPVSRGDQIRGTPAVAGIAPRSGANDVPDFATALPGIDTTGVVAVPMPCALARLFDFAQERLGKGVVSVPPEARPKVHRFEPFDRLELRLRTPRFPSFVLIDYFANDGNVYHLDSDHWPDTIFPPGRAVTIGGRRGIGVEVTLTPPATDELMVVTASAASLFPEGRALAGEPAAYVEDLKDRIEEHLGAGGTVEILATVVSTVVAEGD